MWLSESFVDNASYEPGVWPQRFKSKIASLDRVCTSHTVLKRRQLCYGCFADFQYRLSNTLIAVAPPDRHSPGRRRLQHSMDQYSTARF